jgi:hypothetical protein
VAAGLLAAVTICANSILEGPESSGTREALTSWNRRRGDSGDGGFAACVSAAFACCTHDIVSDQLLSIGASEALASWQWCCCHSCDLGAALFLAAVTTTQDSPLV